MRSPVKTLKKYDRLEELLLDKDLAGLGDAYVNFIYSLAMSQRYQRPMGVKVKNQTLADAVEKSGLRRLLPRRVDLHKRGNAAEALLVFAWLGDLLDLDNCVQMLSEEEEPARAFANLLREVLKKLDIVPKQA
jgi:hypothetical protein